MKKIKINKNFLIKVVLILGICILFFVFIKLEVPIVNNQELQNTYSEKENDNRYFEMPDRIVYKVKNEDKYYVFEKESEEYGKIVNQLIKCIDSQEEGNTLIQSEIKQIEDNNCYIELDYNTISKNYIINYQDEKYNVIKRTDNGGLIVKNQIKQKEKLEDMISSLITDNKNSYKMSDTKQYNVDNTIKDDIEATNNLKLYETGIYGKILENKEEWEKYKNNNYISMSQEISDEVFEKTNVLLITSKYKVEGVDTRIGGVTVRFYGQPAKDQLYVHIICLSKAINQNCIYRDLSNTESKERIYGEELKQEMLSHTEINLIIKDLKKSGNNIILTGEMQQYYDQYDIVKFNVDIIVNKNTTILSSTDNQFEQLQMYKNRGDTIYVTLNTEEKAKGNLVANNIEVLGC